MVIKEKIESAINEQINAELYSAYLYLAMSTYYSSKNLSGFANWMKLQAQEEVNHAIKLYDYLLERGGRPVLKAIDEPPKEWESPLDAFEEAYEHEKKVTDMVNNLLRLATEENDYATMSMLQWFVDEQVEEEASTSEVVERLRLASGFGGGLFMIDRELAQRKAG